MPRPELLAELAAARPAAPPELRARVAALTAGPPRRRPWAALALLPAAAAAAALALALGRGGEERAPAERAVALKAAAPADATGRATAIVRSLGGSVVSADARTLLVHVPAARVGEALRRLSTLGAAERVPGRAATIRLRLR